jgi:predicted PurR-regulated permease PerM
MTEEGADAGRPVASDASAAAIGRLTPPEIVPDWLINLAALGWRVFVIVALIVALWLLATVLWVVAASILVAIVIAAFFAPYALRLRARGRSRTAAAAIVWVAALGIVGGGLLLLGLAMLPYLVDLVQQLDAGVQKLQADLAALNLPPIVATLVHGLVGVVRDVSGGFGGQLVNSAAGVVTVAILGAFLVFFFLRDGDKAWVWIFQAASDQKRERITEAGDDALWRVGGYLRGTTILSALIALTDYLFMIVLGVPLALPLALLAFFSGYIPYFGGFVATGIIVLVTYAALGIGPVIALLVLIGIRNAILGYGVRPTVYGKSVHIHPAMVLVVLPAGYELAGVVGLFAAVPVAAIVFAVAGATIAILDPGPRPGLPALVPSWLDRVAAWSWRILVAVGLAGLFIGIFVAMPLVVIPVVLALILAATLDPLVLRLMRGGRSRTVSSAISVGGGFLAILGVLVITVLSLVNQAADLHSAAVSGAALASTNTGGQLNLLTQAVSGGGDIVRHAIAGAQLAAQVAVIVILSVLLAFYFLADGGKLWANALRRVRPDVAPEVDAAGSRAFEVLGGYMIGTGAISFVGAASQLVIMVVLGIPLALPVFVLSFFLCFIPYIGGFISTGIAFLVTIAVGSPADIAIMAVWTLIFNIVTGNIVTPLVYGRMVHLHPAVVLVAIPGGAAIAGILGMFIVVPAMAVVAATWRTVLAVIGVQRRTSSSSEVPAPDDAPALSASDSRSPDASAPEPA